MLVKNLKTNAVENLVVKEQYHHFPDTLMVVCCLTLRNGFSVTGESHSVSDEDFDIEESQRLALDKAQKKAWEFEAFMIKEIMNANALDRVRFVDVEKPIIDEPDIEPYEVAEVGEVDLSEGPDLDAMTALSALELEAQRKADADLHNSDAEEAPPPPAPVLKIVPKAVALAAHLENIPLKFNHRNSDC